MVTADKGQYSWLGSPPDLSLPFFAYGIFKVGEIAWPRIIRFVESYSETSISDHKLVLRDGVPQLFPANGHTVKGHLLLFTDPQEAFLEIGTSEPRSLYKWLVLRTETGSECNALVGRSKSGFVEIESPTWSSAMDPAFGHGMAYVRATIVETAAQLCISKPWDENPDDWRAFFSLQGAYMVLWSIIERFASFRYGADDGAQSRQLEEEPSQGLKIRALEAEECYLEAFSQANVDPSFHVNPVRENKTKTLTRDGKLKPEKSLSTYYQMRSNITHRGKSAWKENQRLLVATIDLFNVFRSLFLSEVPGYRQAWEQELAPLNRAEVMRQIG